MIRKIDIVSRIERYKRFYNNGEKGSILVVVNLPGGESTTAVNFREFNFNNEKDHKKYWEVLVDHQMEVIRQHEDIDDDFIPGIDLYYGFGSFGGVYCDSEIVFTDDTSYMKPVIESWDKAPGLLYSGDRFWSHIFVEAARYLSKKGYGLFMVDAYPSPSPLDVANLLRGNDLFTDFHEYPDELKKFLNLSSQAVVENAKTIRKALDNPWGGTFAFNKWIPGGLLLLEDAADLCSPQIYQEFGLSYTQNVITEMGGAYIHHHSLGRQQYRNITMLKGLFVQQISSDPNCTRPMKDMDFLLGEVGDTVVELECLPEEVYSYIDHLRKGRFIISVDCTDKEEAQELVSFVRKNSLLK